MRSLHTVPPSLKGLSFVGLEFPLLLSDGIAFDVRMVVARLVSSCACFIVCCIVLRAVCSLCGVLEMTTGNGDDEHDVLSRYMPLMNAFLFLLWNTIVLQSPIAGE